jgi:hypothetical protein
MGKAADSRLVFLGGTAANNNWRIPYIADATLRGVDATILFNPVVKDWNAEAQKAEEAAKARATSLVFYLADPQQEGNPLSAFSMVEATMSLYDNLDKTVVIFDTTGMTGHPLKAMNQMEKILKARFPTASIFSREESLAWLAAKTTATV